VQVRNVLESNRDRIKLLIKNTYLGMEYVKSRYLGLYKRNSLTKNLNTITTSKNIKLNLWGGLDAEGS